MQDHLKVTEGMELLSFGILFERVDDVGREAEPRAQLRDDFPNRICVVGEAELSPQHGLNEF